MAATLASKKAKRAWEIGIALSGAWVRFAPTDMASEYEQIPGFFEGLKLNPKPESGFDIFKSLSDGITKSQYRTKLENQMKEHLLTDLFNGQLIATGYREFPSISQSPVMIDPEKFENDDPDWREESIVSYGVRYGRIRITDPSFLEDGADPAPQSSSISVIENAIAQLAKANWEFAELPRKQSCEMVREFLSVVYKPGNGLSDKNIAKAIVRICGNRRIKPNSS